MANDLNKKGHRIVTKWFQPYMILESAKNFFNVVDYTFNGQNKFDIMDEFLSEIKKAEKITVGLYMKNVNKFYLLTLKDNLNEESDILALENLLFKNRFGSQENLDSDDWIEITTDTDRAFNMIDLGKAEASFIMDLD